MLNFSNQNYLGQTQDRIIEPYWMDILDTIEGIELELNSHGYVRDYGTYEDTDDSEEADEDESGVQEIQQMSLNEIAVSQSADESMPGMIKNSLCHTSFREKFTNFQIV